MTDMDSAQMSCRSCGHPLECPRMVLCSECGLPHAVATSTPRDRAPALWLALVMAAVAVTSMAGFALLAAWQRHDDRLFSEIDRIGREKEQALSEIQVALLDDASMDSKHQDTRAWRASGKVFDRHIPRMPLVRRSYFRDATLWVSCGCASLGGAAAFRLAWITRIQRFGELSEEELRGRKRLLVICAGLLMLSWLVVLLNTPLLM
jgi:hypothetical protein